MASTNKEKEISFLLNQLKKAPNQQDKLAAAADLLGELGLIVNTPSGKYRWLNPHLS